VLSVISRRRTLPPFTHEITKTKQTIFTKKKEKKQYKRGGRCVRPHHLKGSFYSNFGRTGGQLKLVTWQALTGAGGLDHRLMCYLSSGRQVQNYSKITYSLAVLYISTGRAQCEMRRARK
jgi:hypothetical protein